MTQEPQEGWEVEGFINRLTKRDDTNSERLVLEAISHLRGFSRDCDSLRADNKELRIEIERLNTGIHDAIETLERNSTSTPVLEVLRALESKS